MIYSKENFKLRCFRCRQKLAILQSSKPRVTDRLAVVVRKGVPESLVDTLINHNALFLRAGEQKFLCLLERSDSRFTRNGSKPDQELLERLSAFQVVEHRLDRHSCSAKDGSSAENVPTFGQDLHHVIVPRTEVWRGIARFVLSLPKSPFSLKLLHLQGRDR